MGQVGFAYDVSDLVGNNTFTGFTVIAVKFWVNLGRLLLYGYLFAYFLSGQTLIYLLLRREVEGDAISEITMEDEEELEEAFEAELFKRPAVDASQQAQRTERESESTRLPLADSPPEEA